MTRQPGACGQPAGTLRDRRIPPWIYLLSWVGGADVGEDLIGLLPVGEGRVVVGSDQRVAEGRVRVCRA